MSRHTIIPAAHIFLIKDNQILLARRCNTGYEDGNYSVPSGHIEQGETATVGVMREAKEEAGVICDPDSLRCVHIMHRLTPEPREGVDFFFVCTKWEGEIHNPEPEKCDDLRWFPLEALPKNTIPYIRKAISYYRESIFYSETGWE